MRLLLWVTAVCSIVCLIHTHGAHGGCMGRCSPILETSRSGRRRFKWTYHLNNSNVCRNIRTGTCAAKKALFKSCGQCLRDCFTPPDGITTEQYGRMICQTPVRG
uniref:Monolaris n=1 Tax=Rhipicephalus pulchellus TaxID=72859 RepID=L7LUP9_RHIPC